MEENQSNTEATKIIIDITTLSDQQTRELILKLMSMELDFETQ